MIKKTTKAKLKILFHRHKSNKLCLLYIQNFQMYHHMNYFMNLFLKKLNEQYELTSYS